MSVAASVVLGQARSLLNDPGATNWTDTVLMPLLQIGHQELQVALRASDSPVMKGLVIDVALADDTTTVANPTSIIEPIRLWERTQASTDYTSYVLMTEVDDLPLVEPGGMMPHPDGTSPSSSLIPRTPRAVTPCGFTSVSAKRTTRFPELARMIEAPPSVIEA